MNLKDCLRKLESEGRLCHVKTEVDPVHELAGIAPFSMWRMPMSQSLA